MTIPSDIIQKLNSAFGIAGRPHRILDYGEWIDTGCMEWSKSQSVADIFSEMSPDLKDAYLRFCEFLQRGTQNASDTATAEFFSLEPASIQAEFAEFTKKTQEANSPYVEIPALPELSPEYIAASERIFKRLEGETFFKGKIFDSDRYVERIRELFDEEPPHIQTELAALKLHMQERDRQFARTARQKKHTLKQIRTLMQNQPLTAFRAGIEWEGMASRSYETIVIAPTIDQFDILRYERTNGANHGLQTEDVIEKLKKVNETYGVDIVGACMDGVEFLLKRVPKGKKALELGKWLLEICPDLYEAPSSYPKRKVALWWD